MKKKNGISLLMAVAVAATFALPFGCSKGMGVGGTHDNPAAVDTSGVPPLPAEHGGGAEHGAEATHAEGAPAEGPGSEAAHPPALSGTDAQPGHEGTAPAATTAAPAATDTAAHDATTTH